MAESKEKIEIRKPCGFALKFLRMIPEKDNFLSVDVLGLIVDL